MPRALRIFTAALRTLCNVLVIAFFSIARADAQGFEPIDGDDTKNAAFLGVILAKPVNHRLDVFALGAYRTGEIDFTVVNAGLKINPNKHLSFAAGYFGLYQQSTSARPNPRDHRIRLDGEIRRSFGSMTLQHRERFEYRFRDTGDGWRWRPEIRATWDTQIAGQKLSPFLAIEPFYEFNEARWTVILTQAGATIPVAKGLALQPTYIRATVLDGDDLNFFSLFLKYRFQ